MHGPWKVGIEGICPHDKEGVLRFGGKMLIVKICCNILIALLVFASCFGPFDPYNPPPERPSETDSPDNTDSQSTDNPQNTTYPSSMVAYWKCDDSSSTDMLKDELENHHGEIEECNWVEGLDSGMAIGFDGSESFVRIARAGDSLFNFNTDDFTISLWVKAKINTPSNDSTPFCIISKGVSLENGFSLGIYEKFNRFTAMVGNSETVNSDSLATPTSETAWYHLVMLRHSATVELWINGRLSQSFTSTVNVSTSSPLFFGRDASLDKPGRYFSGVVDEIKIFNEAWDDRDVSSEYNRLK
jgi:hypothetical protein